MVLGMNFFVRPLVLVPLLNHLIALHCIMFLHILFVSFLFIFSLFVCFVLVCACVMLLLFPYHMSFDFDSLSHALFGN